jgi:hypothetical protein
MAHGAPKCREIREVYEVRPAYELQEEPQA